MAPANVAEYTFLNWSSTTTLTKLSPRPSILVLVSTALLGISAAIVGIRLRNSHRARLLGRMASSEQQIEELKSSNTQMETEVTKFRFPRSEDTPIFDSPLHGQKPFCAVTSRMLAMNAERRERSSLGSAKAENFSADAGREEEAVEHVGEGDPDVIWRRRLLKLWNMPDDPGLEFDKQRA